MNANDIDETWIQSSSNNAAEANHVDDVALPEENELLASNFTTTPPPTPAPPVTDPGYAPVPPPHLASPTEIKQAISDTASQVISGAKVSAGQAIDKSKDTAGQAIDATKQQVMQQLSTQKERAADAIGNFKAPISEISQTFTNHGQPQLSSLSKSLADQIGHVSDYLHTNDFDVITRDAQAYAKANPAIVIGGAFLLGIIAARFFKSTASAAATTDPLLPVVQSNYAAIGGSNRSDFDEPLPDHAPLTAHGYVDGGVVGGANA